MFIHTVKCEAEAFRREYLHMLALHLQLKTRMLNKKAYKVVIYRLKAYCLLALKEYDNDPSVLIINQ